MGFITAIGTLVYMINEDLRKKYSLNAVVSLPLSAFIVGVIGIALLGLIVMSLFNLGVLLLTVSIIITIICIQKYKKTKNQMYIIIPIMFFTLVIFAANIFDVLFNVNIFKINYLLPLFK